MSQLCLVIVYYSVLGCIPDDEVDIVVLGVRPYGETPIPYGYDPHPTLLRSNGQNTHTTKSDIILRY